MWDLLFFFSFMFLCTCFRISKFLLNLVMIASAPDKSEKYLSWKQRIQIAIDAAKGKGMKDIAFSFLSYNGSKPPIVHRDIKSRNILLNEKLRGKIGDFGLSKIFPDDGDTHVFTIIAGTPGYVDPQ